MISKVIGLTLLFTMSAYGTGATTATSSQASQLIIMTERGPVRGIATPVLREFLGIPYATPPVGNLRWRPPQGHARWSTPLDATKFGNHCPQEDSFFGIGSLVEDCLFLNVFAPNHQFSDADGSPSQGHPVMVWIHGGALTVGESNDYIPTKLVQQGDVIVVTINYRLGALGFLAHPALTAESVQHASGNYGIMDQQFALKWVRRNIAAFGGDPHDVTIFGESAGGLSVLANLVSPLVTEVFQRTIVESGAYELSLPTLEDAESKGTDFANSVGCSNQSAECLRSASVETILANQGGFLGTSPNVDGYVLPQSLDAAFANGQFNRVPVVQGSNHDEMTFFVALDELAGHALTAEEYPLAVADFVGPEAAPAVLAQYPLSKYTSPGSALSALETDSIFACPARKLDQFLSANVPTFAYEFNDINAPEIYLPPVSFPYGAAHAAELQYLFELPQSVPLDASQRELSTDMVRYWTQFARSGEPNSVVTAFWSRYDPTVDGFQSLVPPSPVAEFEFAADHKCDFWAQLFQASSGDQAFKVQRAIRKLRIAPRAGFGGQEKAH
jgi:para-nitrobenzyl esterase